MAPAVKAVGVDNGGTWIRLKGLNVKGRCVWSVKKPSPPLEKLPLFLHQQLKRFKGDLSTLAIGSRGLWKPAKCLALSRAVRGLAAKIIVMSDVEAAWLAAFGSAGEGIIVISGTGSIAYGRASDGRTARAGGLGPHVGDEGSGFWIGCQWLGVNGEKVQDVRKVASLTPSIIRRARRGNTLARKIINEAQNHLVTLVHQLSQKLRYKGAIPISVSGSVLENKWFRRGFIRSLHRKSITFHFISKKMDPAVAPLGAPKSAPIGYHL